MTIAKAKDTEVEVLECSLNTGEVTLALSRSLLTWHRISNAL